MKVSDIPFNMKTIVDESFVEVPSDLNEFSKGIDFIIDKINAVKDIKVKASLHSLVGNFLRVANRLDEAEEYLTFSVDKFAELDIIVASHIAKYRLGIVYFLQNKVTKADDTFLQIMYEIKQTSSEHLMKIHDGVLFYLAISKSKQGMKSQALDYLSESLELRLIKGNMEAADHCTRLMKFIDEK